MQGSHKIFYNKIVRSNIVIVLCEFFTLFLTGGFSLESEWHFISTGLQDSSKYSSYLNSAVSWMASILPLISISQSLFSRPLGTVSRTPNTTGINHCHLHVPQFFQLSGKIQVLSYFFTFIFTIWSTGRTKSTRWQVLFFLLISKTGIGWSIDISKF